METKTCNTCKQERPIEEYYRRGGKPIINCKKCRETGEAVQDLERKGVREFTEKYGISYSEYDEMLLAQQGRCAICKSEDPKGRWSGNKRAFCVDHDHSTGAVRGLLCNTCNQGLGNFFDNTGFLSEAIDYINTHNKKSDRLV